MLIVTREDLTTVFGSLILVLARVHAHFYCGPSHPTSLHQLLYLLTLSVFPTMYHQSAGRVSGPPIGGGIPTNSPIIVDWTSIPALPPVGVITNPPVPVAGVICFQGEMWRNPLKSKNHI